MNFIYRSSSVYRVSYPLRHSYVLEENSFICWYFTVEFSDGEPSKMQVKHQTALFLWPRKRSQRNCQPNVHVFFHHIFDASDWFIGIPSRIGYAYWTNNWRLYLSNNWFLGRPCANSIYFQKAGSKEVVALSGNGYDGRWTSSSVQSVFGMQRLSGCQLVETFLLLLRHGYYKCGRQHSGDQSSFNHLHCSWDSARRRSVNCYKVNSNNTIFFCSQFLDSDFLDSVLWLNVISPVVMSVYWKSTQHKLKSAHFCLCFFYLSNLCFFFALNLKWQLIWQATITSVSKFGSREFYTQTWHIGIKIPSSRIYVVRVDPFFFLI